MSFNWDGIERRRYVELSIFDYWLIFKKNYKLLLAIVLVIFIPSLIYISLQPKVYQARCVLLSRLSTPSYIAEQSAIASSYEVVSGLQKRIYGDIADSKEPKIKLKVEPKRNCGILTFSYEDTDKNKALDVVRKWVRRYLILNQIYSAQKEKDKSNIIIITKPYLVGVVKPQRVKNMVMGLMFSLFAGCGVVFLKYYWEEAKKNRK